MLTGLQRLEQPLIYFPLSDMCISFEGDWTSLLALRCPRVSPSSSPPAHWSFATAATRDIDIHGIHAGHLEPASGELCEKCRVMQIFFFWTRKCLGPGGALGTVPFFCGLQDSMFIEPCQKLSSQYSGFSLTKFSETKNYNKHINSEIRKLEFVLI